MSRCKGCDAEIDWVKNPRTGKAMPVDVRRLIVVTDAGDVVEGRLSHFATCSAAGQFRRKPIENSANMAGEVP